jgi:hypothetical protein
MKSIDVKSLFIGFLLCTCFFLFTAQSRGNPKNTYGRLAFVQSKNSESTFYIMNTDYGQIWKIQDGRITDVFKELYVK